MGLFSKIFGKKDSGLLWAVDIGSHIVKVVIVEASSKKIVSYGKSLMEEHAIKNGVIIDIKWVVNAVSKAISDAEERIWKSISSVIFGINSYYDAFSQKSYRWFLQTIVDEVGWRSLWYYSLPTIYPCWNIDIKNCLVVDIWAWTTSIVLIKDGKMKKVETFSLGGNIFTRRIAKIFAISQIEANNIKILYSKGDVQNLEDKDFQDDLDLWMSWFGVTLKNLWEEELPSTIYITWWGACFTIIKNALRNKNYPYKRLWFVDQPLIKSLSAIKRFSLEWDERKENYSSWDWVKVLWRFWLEKLEQLS